MKLRDLKYHLLEERVQIFVFDLQGMLHDACHSLIDVHDLIGASVFNKWPVLESIRPVLDDLNSLEIPFRLPAVELNLPKSTGIFDFEFYPHPKDPGKIIWLMIDQSKIYRYFQRIQQERNMLLLEKEYRETGRHIKITSALDK